MDLLNSQSTRTAGRSPAVDFWSHREKRLTGLRNYCKLWRRTDKTSAATQSKDGYTTLWVMRARKFKKEMPAEASISLKTAESVADLVCCDGKELAAVLRKCGIVESDQKLSVDLLEHYCECMRHVCGVGPFYGPVYGVSFLVHAAVFSSPRAEAADCRPWPLAVVMDDNLERLKAQRDQLKRSLKEASKVLKVEAGQS